MVVVVVEGCAVNNEQEKKSHMKKVVSGQANVM